MSARFGRLPWLWLSVLVIAFDQATKHYFEANFSLYQKVDVVPGYFAWTLAYNTGAAFSFLADHGGWQRWLFAVIAVGVSVVLVVWLMTISEFIKIAKRKGYKLDGTDAATSSMLWGMGIFATPIAVALYVIALPDLNAYPIVTEQQRLAKIDDQLPEI